MSRMPRAAAPLLLSALLAVVPGCGGGGYGGGGGGGSTMGGGRITTITVMPAMATIAVGETQQFMAVAKDMNGMTVNVPFKWVSSDTDVTTITSSGLATGVGGGTATITASYTYSGGAYGGTTITSNGAQLTVTTSGMVMGTAAVGHALPGALVTARDRNGATAAAVTDDHGRFSIVTAGLAAPLLLKADDGRGHVLFGFAIKDGVVNIHPFTDMLARLWFRAHGMTPASAFAVEGSPMPGATMLHTLDKAAVTLLAPALRRAGLAVQDFSLTSTPFRANHTGFDAVLDETRMSIRRGELQVLSAGTHFGARATRAAIELGNDRQTFVVRLSSDR